MTRILVIHYAQTGQATRAVQSMLAPLQDHPDFELVWQNLEPVEPYPFPWPFFRFFDIFPECIQLDPPPLKPLGVDPDAHYDLVVIAYQVWFLAPSLPITAFLKSPAARVLQGKPVITLVACRNMWLNAQETVKQLLRERGARLIDHVAVVDQGPPWTTFVTTARWMFTGRRNGFWGVFQPAGVSDAQIARLGRFGRALRERHHLLQSRPDTSLLSGLGAVTVNPGYIASERIAHRSFRIWGRLLRAIGKQGNPARRAALIVYIVFLIAMILTVAPLGIAVRASMRPLLRARMDRQVARLELPSGSATGDIDRYERDTT